jgi:hypothetical protein
MRRREDNGYSSDRPTPSPTPWCEGDWVALEMDWIGIIAVQIQNLPPDSEMRDHAAVFLQFRDGRVARQRHYDCFEP